MISRILPAPKFLSMKGCGLDISSHTLRFIELSSYAKEGISHLPIRYGVQALPEGVIVLGEIAKKDDLIQSLKIFKQKYKLDFVTVSLPEEKEYLFKTTIPTTNEKQFADAVAFTLEENVPIAGADALVEWDSIERRPRETALSVFVVPRDTVESYLEVLNAAGLTPVGFDIKIRAMARAVVPSHDERNFMIASIAAAKTLLCVVSNNVPQFTSTILSGTTAFTAIIQKYRNCGPDEAKKILHTKNFIQSTDPEDKAIQQEFLEVLERLNLEIKRVSAYWYMRKDNDEKTRKINTIAIMGENALIPGLVDYFSSHQDVPVQLANAWENCFSLNSYIPEIPLEESIHYSVAIGLALA